VNTILAASDELFRARVHERLIQADCEGIRVAESPAALVGVLPECRGSIVLTGDGWPSSRPFLWAAVRAGVPAIVLLNAATHRVAQAVLAEGAQGALDADISATSLGAAVAAVRSGLIVLDQPLATNSAALQTNALEADEALLESAPRPARPLTSRERQILSLVASGTSNKGVARALDVSVNTVKFHLAAVFEKLNVTTRAEAVAEAIRRGELSL
jgi:DNA-binding NarL/FixJ family response regulator